MKYLRWAIYAFLVVSALIIYGELQGGTSLSFAVSVAALPSLVVAGGLTVLYLLIAGVRKLTHR